MCKILTLTNEEYMGIYYSYTFNSSVEFKIFKYKTGKYDNMDSLQMLFVSCH